MDEKGLARTLAYAAALGLAGLFALGLLTAAAVEALDHALGEPWGALLVGLAYVAAGLAVFVAMRRAEARAAEAQARNASTLKEDVAHVVAPVVDALGAAPPETTRRADAKA